MDEEPHSRIDEEPYNTVDKEPYKTVDEEPYNRVDEELDTGVATKDLGTEHNSSLEMLLTAKYVTCYECIFKYFVYLISLLQCCNFVIFMNILCVYVGMGDIENFTFDIYHQKYQIIGSNSTTNSKIICMHATLQFQQYWQ